MVGPEAVFGWRLRSFFFPLILNRKRKKSQRLRPTIILSLLKTRKRQQQLPREPQPKATLTTKDLIFFPNQRKWASGACARSFVVVGLCFWEVAWGAELVFFFNFPGVFLSHSFTSNLCPGPWPASGASQRLEEWEKKMKIKEQSQCRST